jgi:hypothetical protein
MEEGYGDIRRGVAVRTDEQTGRGIREKGTKGLKKRRKSVRDDDTE